MRPSFRLPLVAALCLLSAPVFSAGASSPPDDLAACKSKGGDVEIRKDGWTRIGPPAYDNGAAEGAEGVITTYTTSPQDPNRVYATNGEVIKRSLNGGCDWTTLWRGSNNVVPNVDNNPDVITQMVSPTSSALWVATYDDNKGVPRPHVYNGNNMGSQDTSPPGFNPIDTGLPAYGKPVDFDIARYDFDTAAFVLIDALPDPSSGDPMTPSRHLYTTYEQDVSPPPPAPPLPPVLAWKELELPDGFGAVKGITAGNSGHTVWAWSDTKFAVMHKANEDGADWIVKEVPGKVVTVDVNIVGDTQVVVANGDSPGFMETVDPIGGVTARKPLPVAPTAFTHGRRRDVYIVSGKGGTWGWDLAQRKWEDISPKGVAEFTSIEMANGVVNHYVLGRAGNDLYRWDTYPVELFHPPRVPLGGFGDFNQQLPWKSLAPPSLVPRMQVLTIEPGKPAAPVPVDFQVGPFVTPLNVFFLVDTTSSMGAAIKGLTHDLQGIAGKLSKTLGENACFGVGEIKDNVAGSVGADPEDPNGKAYRVRQKIDCLPDNLQRTVATIGKLSSWGGGDKPEAQTIALQQSVTGTGWRNPPVDQGQEAGWGALPKSADPRFITEPFKVIVLVTDSQFHQGSDGATGGIYPKIDQAVASLNAVHVKVVNVVVGGSSGVNEDARRDMQEVARGTDTVAPVTGVDCDGDGKMTSVDLGPGDPLVCESSGSDTQLNMGPAVIGLLLGVRDPGTIAVDVDDEHRVVRTPILGPTRKVVNLKYRNALHFTMPLACTDAQDGKDLPVDLFPTVRGFPAGLVGQVIVRCRSVPVLPKPKPPEPVIDPPVKPRPLVAAAPPPPPAPVQPISNINPNAGFSQQEEEQFQVAAVGQDASEEQQEEAEEGVEAMEMTALDQESPAAAGLVFGGAAMLSSMAAVAYRRRLQRSTRKAYVR